MEIQKVPVPPWTLIGLTRQREPAVALEKVDARRGGLDVSAEHAVKVNAYDPDEFESLIRQFTGRRVAAEEYRVQHHSAALSNRAKQALNAYLLQQDLPQAEVHTALAQMLGVDYYA